MTRLTVVVGGQYGSEGKGAVVGFLARNADSRTTVIRVAGPNAGHTAYDNKGREWKLRAVPVAAVTSLHCQLHIAAGSEIDPVVLADEVTALDEAGHNVSARLTVHPSATILLPQHIRAEQEDGIVGRIGSTGKGIGAARSQRIARTAPLAQELYQNKPGILSHDGPFDIDGADHIVIEGTQGYGLGLHTRQYPQVTSSDCRALDFLAMAGISPWAYQFDQALFTIWVVARMYPIRVAGNSGPLRGETTWADLGLPEEHTTVTHKVRRVGEWDMELLHEAVVANGGGDFTGPVKIALTMVDQKYPSMRNVTNPMDPMPQELIEFCAEVENECEAEISLFGTGPDSMMEVSI